MWAGNTARHGRYPFKGGINHDPELGWYRESQSLRPNWEEKLFLFTIKSEKETSLC